MQRRLWKAVQYVVLGLVALYVIFPELLIVISSVNSSRHFSFPFQGLSVRWHLNVLAHPKWRLAFWNSIKLALTSSAITCVIGLMAALAAYRRSFPGKQTLMTFFLSPLFFPILLTATALLFTVSHFRLGGTMFALVLGHLLLGFPYTFRVSFTTLVMADPNLEDAAYTLGADQLHVLRHITLPLALPGILSGLLFAFAISFGNVIVSIYLHGSQTITLPVRIFQELEFRQDLTVAAVSTQVLLVTLLVMLLIERLTGLEKGL